MREAILAAWPTWLSGVGLSLPDAATLWLLALWIGVAGWVARAACEGLDSRATLAACAAGAVGALAAGRLWVLLLDVPHAAAGGLWSGEKSVMGLIAGAVPCTALALRLAHRPVLPYLDAAAPVACIAYAVARLGCLLAGCCFGVPTALPWGIAYPPGSEAYALHAAAGLINTGAPGSLPVHPVPIYHALLGLLLAVLAWRTRGAPGRSTAVALGGYAVARFLLEFVRADLVVTAAGLSAAQIGCLGFAVVATLLWRAGTAPQPVSAPARLPG